MHCLKPQIPTHNQSKYKAAELKVTETRALSGSNPKANPHIIYYALSLLKPMLQIMDSSAGNGMEQ